MSIDDYLRQNQRLKDAMGLSLLSDQAVNDIISGKSLVYDRLSVTSVALTAAEEAARCAIGSSVANHIASGAIGSTLAEEAILGIPSRTVLDHANGTVAAHFLAEQERNSRYLQLGAVAGSFDSQIINSLPGSVIEEARRAGLSVSDHFSGLATGIAREEAMRMAMASLDTMSITSRAAQWSSILGGISSVDINELLKPKSYVEEQLAALSQMASRVSSYGAIETALDAFGATGSLKQATALKMSTFAGAIDMFGSRSSVSSAAFDALFGSWRSHGDLPEDFWEDSGFRHRMYRDADVDQGLVDADEAQIIEVLIETGVVEGNRDKDSRTAIINVGPKRMMIKASDARGDAHHLLDQFELNLRAFISARMSDLLACRGEKPERWFAMRAPGAIVERAKFARKAALQAGEPMQPLINFTNLGELIDVVLATLNWKEVFAPIFIDRDAFKVDVQRLNAHRRPAAHCRDIDATRLVEIMFTVRRLEDCMGRLLPLDYGWDKDE